VNFTDFHKAFDCSHWLALWDQLERYELLMKIITINQKFLEDSNGADRTSGATSTLSGLNSIAACKHNRPVIRTAGSNAGGS